MTVIVGVDPGASGAIAFLDADTEDLIAVEDMPVDRVQVGRHVRSRVARSALLALLKRAAGSPAFTERPEGRPLRSTSRKTGQTETRQPGAAGMLSLGENYGCVVMGCTATGMRLTEVRPGVWKSALGVKAAKDDSRRRSSELWPAMAHLFERVRDDGRAEAALIALYGARVLKGTMREAAE